MVSRRSLLKLLAATPLAGAASRLSTSTPETVKLFGDGLGLSPTEYIDVLARIAEERGIDADDYSRGGVVEELERKMATELGKERAIYFATGTLANHVAVRVLARDRTRVLVPKDSHIYNDSGDCAQQLSQLNLVPLVSESATFTLAQVEEEVKRAGTGRVVNDVGALLIESPVRRKLGETFDYEEMKRICSFAREHGIKTHLDGARLYLQSGFSGVSPREYASHFDTVYVSLWKYFNAASGAILAGPKDVIDELYHTRRMFGGGLPAAWPFAAVTLHYLKGFEAEFGAAVRTAKKLFSLLNADPSFEVAPIPRGSNIFKMVIRGTDPARFRDQLKSRGVLLSQPRGGTGEFLVTVNATWNRTDAETLSKTFQESRSA